MHDLVGELRYAARVLWRNRLASIVAFVTLALAIGATTAIFSVVDRLLLRALPFPEADRLVQLARGYPGTIADMVSVPKFMYWRTQRELFERVAAYDSLGAGFNLVGAGTPERLAASRVSAEFFATLGVSPALGRDFRPDEDVPGGPKLVVLSHDLWTNRFGARPDTVGSVIRLNDEPYTVIGVMPDGFRHPEFADFWTLTQFEPSSRERANYFEVVARLRPGVSLEQARAAMQTAAAAFRQDNPDLAGETETVAVRPLQERLYGSMRPALLILLGAVGFVLLIACVNVAHLRLAQAAERGHEIALRTALGAGTGAIVRQLLLESVLLATVSGAAGVVLAYWAVPVLVAFAPTSIPRSETIAVDLRVLGFAFVVSVLAGVAFGLLPAWQAARQDLDRVLRAGSSRTSGSGRAWTRRMLVAGEVALALVLTIGASLLLKSFGALRSTSPGFTVEHVLTMKLALPERKYGTGEALARFHEQIEEAVRAVPGVRHAGLTQSLPMELGPDLPFIIEGKYVPGTETGVGSAQYRGAGGEYFAALRIPLRRGRLFDDRDRRGSLPVAIVNETAVREIWRGENPIGQRIVVGQPFVPELADAVPREIVGVVGDVRERGLSEEVPPILYVPMSQQNDQLTALAVRLLPFALVIRGEGAVASLTQGAREAVWRVDPEQPIADVRLMSDIVARSIGSQRFNTWLLGAMAALALLLAAVGLYGVLSHLVGQQTREIGVRMALGATEGRILRSMVGHALVMAGVGIGVGLVAAFGLTRFLRSLLTGISATDPWVFVLAPALMIGVAVVAAMWPAARAARVDPARALRAE